MYHFLNSLKYKGLQPDTLIRDLKWVIRHANVLPVLTLSSPCEDDSGPLNAVR